MADEPATPDIEDVIDPQKSANDDTPDIPTFEDEDPPEGVNLVQHLRNELKERNKEIRELEQYRPKDQQKRRERPSLWDDHNGDEEAYAADLEKWFGEEAELKTQQTAQEQQRERVQQQLEEKRQIHATGIQALGQDDAGDMDALVKETLLPWQHEVLLRYTSNSPALTYALGKNPAKLAQLASENQDVIQFAYSLRELEGKMNMSKQRRAVDKPVTAGDGSPLSNDFDERMKAAERRADETGDRTEVIRLRRERKQA